MKESGINWFFTGALALNTGSFAVMYTFEEGAGTVLNSVTLAQPQFSAVLGSAAGFWPAPGSGFFNGSAATIANASGLDSTSWTKIFVYEKVNVDPCVLFDSMVGTSGHRIGITKANKPYMESFNDEPVLAASLNNYSSKNAVTFTYLPNYLMMGYYNWNSQQVETESFTYPFNLARSDSQRLGPAFTGYMDYYIHLTQPLSAEVQSQLLSGLFAYPTGYGYTVETICTTGITGYQNVVITQTGVTGQITLPGGDEGRDYYTGAFPTYHSTTYLTGVLSTGLYASGLTGSTCFPVTGDPSTLFRLLTGYASSFGMEKVQLFTYIEPTDITKQGVSYTPFVDAYNKVPLRQYSGWLMNPVYDSGEMNCFMNGIAQWRSGWNVTGGYIFANDTAASDDWFFDVKAGQMRASGFTGQTGFAFSYSGQEIFLNGVNLISGRDFVMAGANLNLTNLNTGFGGLLFEDPVILPYATGRAATWVTGRFWRNTANIYLNGVREQNRMYYIEGAVFDLLSGNGFNPALCVPLYADTDLYWEP